MTGAVICKPIPDDIDRGPAATRDRSRDTALDVTVTVAVTVAVPVSPSRTLAVAV